MYLLDEALSVCERHFPRARASKPRPAKAACKGTILAHKLPDDARLAIRALAELDL
jgi:hypothetical protein